MDINVYCPGLLTALATVSCPHDAYPLGLGPGIIGCLPPIKCATSSKHFRQYSPPCHACNSRRGYLVLHLEHLCILYLF